MWAGTVEAHYDCAAEEPSFQAPSLRMGDADEVEPDAGGFFTASHGELAVSVPSKGTFVQPLCTVSVVSSLHVGRHPIPLQVTFDEASETVYHNRWVRGLANCFSQLDVSLPTLSQPVHPVGSTATSILAASSQASSDRRVGTLPPAVPAASEVSVPLSQPVHVWRSTASTTGLMRPHPALFDPSWVSDAWGPQAPCTEPTLPDAVAYCVAAPIPVDPPSCLGGGFSMTLARAGLIDALPAEAPRRQYTIFEFQKRPRQRSYGPTWSLQDIVADAVRTASAPTRHVRVLLPVLSGIAAPQLVLTRRDAPQGWFAFPCDMRALGLDIVTVQAPPRLQFGALPEHVRTGAPPFPSFQFPSAAYVWRDEGGTLYTDGPDFIGGWQWLAFEPVAPLVVPGVQTEPFGGDSLAQGDSAASSSSQVGVFHDSTQTTTLARPKSNQSGQSMPAQLLLQAAAAEQADPYHAIGAGLYPACIDFRPAFLRLCIGPWLPLPVQQPPVRYQCSPFHGAGYRT